MEDAKYKYLGNKGHKGNKDVRIDDDTGLKQELVAGDNIENEIGEYAMFRARWQ